MQDLAALIRKLMNNPGFFVSEDDAFLLADPEMAKTVDLISVAERIRTYYKQDRIFLCSILNAKSGACTENCAFCAQSSFHDTKINTYPLKSSEAIVADALERYQSGATHYSIVTSGHSLSDAEIDQICDAVVCIRKKTTLMICGSLGMLSEAGAKKLISSGMGRYHHNLETAESHFEKICTTHTYKEDIDTLLMAHRYGFTVCSGGIFGLGETWTQRVELALRLRELPVDTIPINFLNPIPGTPMGCRPLVEPMDALRIIALFRIINPKKNITICGGREISLKDNQAQIFSAGANGLMVGNYLTTSGRDLGDDHDMIQSLNLRVEQ